MKNLIAILLWSCISLLWVCGGGGVSMDHGREYVSQTSTPESINPSSTQVIAALQQSTSLFELPVQVRVPATQTVVNIFRPVFSLDTDWHLCPDRGVTIDVSKPGQPPVPSPVVWRSADHYVFALRKIVV